MDEYDTIRCLERIRASQDPLASAAVVMISISSNPEIMQQACNLGADHYAVNRAPLVI